MRDSRLPRPEPRRMDSRNIRYLNAAARRKNGSPQAAGLEHLAAAHEKLMRLQGMRRKLKEEYAERVAELDTAMRELEHSRSIISKQTELLDEYDARIRAQSLLIDDLRAEIDQFSGQLERRRPPTARQSDASSITVRALDKYYRNNKRPIDEGSTKPASLTSKLYRRLRSAQILDRR